MYDAYSKTYKLIRSSEKPRLKIPFADLFREKDIDKWLTDSTDHKLNEQGLYI